MYVLVKYIQNIVRVGVEVSRCSTVLKWRMFKGTLELIDYIFLTPGYKKIETAIVIRVIIFLKSLSILFIFH